MSTGMVSIPPAIALRSGRCASRASGIGLQGTVDVTGGGGIGREGIEGRVVVVAQVGEGVGFGTKDGEGVEGGEGEGTDVDGGGRGGSAYANEAPSECSGDVAGRVAVNDAPSAR